MKGAARSERRDKDQKEERGEEKEGGKGRVGERSAGEYSASRIEFGEVMETARMNPSTPCRFYDKNTVI